MRVRYQPICCGEESKRNGLYKELMQNYITYIGILFAVITLSSLYIGGVLTFLFEEDFGAYTYPLEISDAKELVEKIDNYESSLQLQNYLNGPSSKPEKIDYNAVVNAVNSIYDGKDFKIQPIPQFKDFDFLLDVAPSCRSQWGTNKLKSTILNDNSLDKSTFVIIVKSAVNNYARRRAIRSSWYLNETTSLFMFKTVFMVGACHEQNPIPPSALKLTSNEAWSPDECNKHILNESREFGDIIQSSGIDSYYNNTIKTFMTLRWLNERCPSDFNLAIDDDYVLEIDNLIKYLHGLAKSYRPNEPINGDDSLVRSSNFQASTSSNPHIVSRVWRHSIPASVETSSDSEYSAEELIALRRLSRGYLWAGYVRDHVHPLRSVLSKWYITVEEYSYNKYPTYITGGATLMSFKTVKHLYYTCHFTLAFKFDDVYVGIMAQKINLVALHSDNFMCSVDEYLNANPIQSNSTECMAVHDIDPEKLLELWQRRKQQKKDQ